MEPFRRWKDSELLCTERQLLFLPATSTRPHPCSLSMESQHNLTTLCSDPAAMEVVHSSSQCLKKHEQLFSFLVSFVSVGFHFPGLKTTFCSREMGESCPDTFLESACTALMCSFTKHCKSLAHKAAQELQKPSHPKSFRFLPASSQASNHSSHSHKSSSALAVGKEQICAGCIRG